MASQLEALEIYLYFGLVEGKINLKAIEDDKIPANIITPMGYEKIPPGSFEFTAGPRTNHIVTDGVQNTYRLGRRSVIRGYRAHSFRSLSEEFYLADRVGDGPEETAHVLLMESSEYRKPPPNNAVRATTLDKLSKEVKAMLDKKATETAAKKEKKDQDALKQAAARREAKASNDKKTT